MKLTPRQIEVLTNILQGKDAGLRQDRGCASRHSGAYGNMIETLGDLELLQRNKYHRVVTKLTAKALEFLQEHYKRRNPNLAAMAEIALPDVRQAENDARCAAAMKANAAKQRSIEFTQQRRTRILAGYRAVLQKYLPDQCTHWDDETVHVFGDAFITAENNA